MVGPPGRVIRDNRPLEFDYIPPRTPHREAQMSELRTHFSEVVRAGRQSVFLQGPIGSGKTMVSHVFGDWLARRSNEEGAPIKPVYVNCHNRGTDADVLLHVVRQFEERFPDRGFNPAEKMDEIRKHLAKRNLRLLLVLDEADWLYRTPSNIVYNFTRFTEDTGKPNPVSMILVATRPLYEWMDAAAMSTFKSHVVRFPKYTGEQLRDILRDRVEFALFEGSVPEDVLRLMANIAGELGDARRGIEILEGAAGTAQGKGRNVVTAEDVRGAKGTIEPVVNNLQLTELEPHPLLTLLAVARALRRRAETSTGEVERHYGSACEEFKEERRAHTQFWKYLKELESRGIITSQVSGRGQQGKTTVIELRDIPADVLSKRIEELLRSRKK